MKVADITYTGRMRRNSYKTNTGSRYEFKRGVAVPVDNVDDALFFDENKSSTKVEWTAQGKIMKAFSGEVDSAQEALKTLGYRNKQSIAKSLGIKANQDESTLEEELEPVVEELRQDMENL